LARNGKPAGEQGFKPCFEFPDDIPVFTAEHESKLLCECSRFALPDGRTAMMARCDAGDNCVGKNSNIDGHEASGGGVVLRSLLTPEELTVFELTGESPKETRLCILCARWYMASAYFWCQETRNERVLQNTIINWYVNPRDCAGGYRSEMMVPMGAYPGWRCMVGPVACATCPRSTSCGSSSVGARGRWTRASCCGEIRQRGTTGTTPVGCGFFVSARHRRLGAGAE
jgi:hypothetical protein